MDLDFDALDEMELDEDGLDAALEAAEEVWDAGCDDEEQISYAIRAYIWATADKAANERLAEKLAAAGMGSMLPRKCTCEEPIIKCDGNGCRCTACNGMA